MTAKELYEWAVEHGYENYRIICDAHLGNILTKSDIFVDNKDEFLYI